MFPCATFPFPGTRPGVQFKGLLRGNGKKEEIAKWFGSYDLRNAAIVQHPLSLVVFAPRLHAIQVTTTFLLPYSI